MFLILLGPPGAGKGTISGYINENQGLIPISTGNLLREEIERGSQLGREAAKYMNEGQLVPDPLILEMVENYLTSKIINSGFIFDGFPRTIPQAEALDNILDKLNIQLSKVILVEVDREELIQRIQDRRTCSNCQQVYSSTYSPPNQEGICDNCDSELVIRADQEEDVIVNRLVVYKNQTAPLIQYYQDQDLLERYSNGDSRQIAKQILVYLKSIE